MRFQLEEISGNRSVSKTPFRKIASTIPEVPLVDLPNASLIRKKRWHHKARTGCFTCRRRRVKCDEQKPSCLRCCKVNEPCRYERQALAPQPILVRYQPSTMPAVSYNVDFSFLEFFIRNTKDTLSTPPSTLVDRRPIMPIDPDLATASFWNSLGLPLVHTEPLILELVVLLARKHRQALERSKSNDEDTLKVVNVMTEIVKTRSQDIVVVGSMLASAFQILHSTYLEDHSLSNNGVHAIAFSKLLMDSSDAVFQYVKPITDVTRLSLAICASTQEERFLEIPDEFRDLEDARHYFTEIMQCQLLKLRPLLEKWLSAMSKLYEGARGKDWEQNKNILTLFIYGRHMLMHSDVILSVGHDLHAAWEAVEGRALLMSL